jgi:aminoglycoside phosphotransferase
VTASIKLPKALERRLAGGGLQPVSLGRSAASVFRFAEGDALLYLKTQPAGLDETLWVEKRKLDWLSKYLPVPSVEYYGNWQGSEYLLLTAIDGTPASDDGYDRDATVRRYAEGAQQFHQLPLTACPFDAGLSVKIAAARERVARGLVDESDFEPRYRGWTAQQVLDRMLQTMPDAEDPVVTHGDYCLPNVILKQSCLSGFVDVGSTGRADRYQDLALAARSIQHNFGEEYVELFFRQYQIEPDWTKIDFYILLDELF